MKVSIFSAPIGNAYFSEIAFVISTVGAIVPTGVPCSTRFSKASIEQRAPFFVGNFEYASRHVFTTAFSEITSLVKYFLAPSFAHPLGTDELGRDTLTRIIFGARISLTIGLIPTLISMFIGTILGLIAGYFGGKIDFAIMRLADIMLAFPSLLLAMVVMYTMGGGLINIFIALSLVNWASTSRVIRSETLSLSKKEYVEAAKSMGVSNATIIFRHILPNCIPTLVVLFTLSIPSAILSESSLSFLGVGAQPPTASWGLMVVSAKKYLFTQPVLVLAPAMAIMIVVLAFNFLGDGLRDVLDPYLKEQ